MPKPTDTEQRGKVPDQELIEQIAEEITEELDADSSTEEIVEMVFQMGHDIHTALHVAIYLGRVKDGGIFAHDDDDTIWGRAAQLRQMMS